MFHADRTIVDLALLFSFDTDYMGMSEVAFAPPFSLILSYIATLNNKISFQNN